MGRSMTRSLLWAIAIAGVYMAARLALPLDASAQSSSNFRGWDSDDGRTKTAVKAKIETGPNGIDVQMSVRRTGPGERERGEPEGRAAPAHPAAPEAPRGEPEGPRTAIAPGAHAPGAGQ